MTGIGRSERGSALVTAVMVMGLILMLGITLLDMADSIQRRTGDERVRETSFNVSEAALSAQVTALGSSWPAAAATAYPAQCTPTSTWPRCPRATTIAADFAGTAFGPESSWNVEVRDNLGAAAVHFSRAVLQNAPCAGQVPCTWDSNADGAVWVRASATVNGRSRTVVALVRRQLVRLTLPRNVVTAARFSTSNNGRKTIIDGKGCLAKHRPSDTCNAVQPAPVVVRCTTANPGIPGDPCLGYRSDQVAPNVFQQGLTGPVLPSGSLDQQRAYAIQAGTYYTSCPPVTALVGQVFIEGVSCTYNTGIANSAAAPGALTINRGTLTLTGNFTYYGVIYAANNLPAPASAGNIVTLHGNAYVQGAVFVEGDGGVLAGSSGLNVSFDENGLGNMFGASGSPGIVQGSFRELPAGQ